MFTIKGRCNCDAVNFEFKISKEKQVVYMCHCSICRRASGTNGVAVMITDKSEFRWLMGEEKIKTWHKSAHDWACSFCVECGSSLPGENDPERMYVPVGLIDNADLEGVRVAHHLWVDSKAPWDEITDDGEQHRQGIG